MRRTYSMHVGGVEMVGGGGGRGRLEDERVGEGVI
jgi:hypothetical protein